MVFLFSYQSVIFQNHNSLVLAPAMLQTFLYGCKNSALGSLMFGCSENTMQKLQEMDNDKCYYNTMMGSIAIRLFSLFIDSENNQFLHKLIMIIQLKQA